jgi:hypothetical protein
MSGTCTAVLDEVPQDVSVALAQRTVGDLAVGATHPRINVPRIVGTELIALSPHRWIRWLTCPRDDRDIRAADR